MYFRNRKLYSVGHDIVETREMENIRRRGLTFGDFVTVRIEASMRDVTVAGLQEYRLSPLLNVKYCVGVYLCTVKIFLAHH